MNSEYDFRLSERSETEDMLPSYFSDNYTHFIAHVENIAPAGHDTTSPTPDI